MKDLSTLAPTPRGGGWELPLTGAAVEVSGYGTPLCVHRKRRERRPLPRMLLHIDGSHHQWFQDGRWHDLIVILDDATSEIYYAQLAEEAKRRSDGSCAYGGTRASRLGGGKAWGSSISVTPIMKSACVTPAGSDKSERKWVATTARSQRLG